MRLGSLVDGFCAPADADRLIHCAREYLERDGADLIVSNQAHTAWCRGLRRSGFLRGPSNYIFASSSELIKLLCACGVGNADIHVTRGDGDGPIHL
jgi:hypothetical protein